MRAKNHCECCGRWKDIRDLQTSHFIGRRNRAVRFDEFNAAALCFTCHQNFTANPLDHVDWFRKRLGEQAFDLLQSRARITYPKPDKEAITLYLKEQVRRLTETP